MSTVTLKTCTRCKEDLPTSEFGMNRAAKDGLNYYCLPCVREYAQKYKGKAYSHDSYLKRKYGIDAQRYDEMYVEQDGCCKICGAHQTEMKQRLCVDHCHESGKVRGLLCPKCNKAIGLLEDDAATVMSAYLYLETSS